MVETYRRRSALAHFGLAAKAAQGVQQGTDIVLGENPHRSLINIRGDIEDAGFRETIGRVIGVEPPQEANTVSSAGMRRILWLGPSEWLIVGPDGEAENLVAALRDGFGGNHTSVVDVSESRTAITLSGPKARDFLARGVSLDLHPRVFEPGTCAQTGLSRCNVLLHLVDNRPTFDIYVPKSFADYLWRWMELAGQDFKIAVAE